MNRIVLVMVLMLVVSMGAFAAPEVTTVNNLRFEKTVAAKAIKPEPYLKLAFGRDDATIGGSNEDEQKRTEGCPYSFLPQADGSVWLLDAVNRKIKHFAKDGKLLAAVAYAEKDEKMVMRDLALLPGGNFVAIAVNDGKVVVLDAKGAVTCEIEGLHDAWSLGVDKAGNALINVPVMQAVLRFNDKGELLERYDGCSELSVVTDEKGAPYWLKSDDQNAELLKVTAASPTATVSLAKFPLDVPAEAKAHYVSTKVLGTDAKGQIYVELVATDDDGVIHRQRVARLDAEGKVLTQADILPIPYLAPDLPRHLMVMPDGRLMGFSVDEKNYQLHTYTLP